MTLAKDWRSCSARPSSGPNAIECRSELESASKHELLIFDEIKSDPVLMLVKPENRRD